SRPDEHGRIHDRNEPDSAVRLKPHGARPAEEIELFDVDHVVSEDRVPVLLLAGDGFPNALAFPDRLDPARGQVSDRREPVIIARADHVKNESTIFAGEGPEDTADHLRIQGGRSRRTSDHGALSTGRVEAFGQRLTVDQDLKVAVAVVGDHLLPVVAVHGTPLCRDVEVRVSERGRTYDGRHNARNQHETRYDGCALALALVIVPHGVRSRTDLCHATMTEGYPRTNLGQSQP